MRRLLLTLGAVALLAACSRPAAGPSASPATTSPAAPTTMQMPHGTTAPAATPDRTIAVTVTEPVFGPIRRILPAMGGLDLSPLIALLLIFFIQRWLIRGTLL